MAQEILQKFSAQLNWVEIKEDEWKDYGIISLEEAKVLVSYKIGTIYKSFNTLTLFDYGKDYKFINDMAQSYESLQNNAQEQYELGVFPIYWENTNNKFLSVLRLIKNPVMNIVDIFFVYKKIVYCFHNYLEILHMLIYHLN